MKKKYLLSVVSSVTIEKDIAFVSNAVCNIERWSTLSKNFEDSEILINSGNRMLTRIQSHHNSMSFERYTYREIFPENHMYFRHLTTKFPIKTHYGTWNFNRIDEMKTEVQLEHIFKLSCGILGYIFGKFIISPFFFKYPVKKMLLDFKQNIEKQKG
ncbi:MAG: hypothetical protein ACK5KT_16235 [Dysgonomonas sp.]